MARSGNDTSGGISISGGNVHFDGDMVGQVVNVQITAEEWQRILPTLAAHVKALSSTAPDRRAFQDHIEPIYADLKLVVGDYRAILVDIQQKLDSEEPIANIIQELVKERVQFAQTREEILQYVQILKESNRKFPPGALANFAAATTNVLAAGPTVAENLVSPIMTRLTSLIENFQHMQELHAPREEYSKTLKEVSANLDRSWNVALKAYLELRAVCLD